MASPVAPAGGGPPRGEHALFVLHCPGGGRAAKGGGEGGGRTQKGVKGSTVVVPGVYCVHALGPLGEAMGRGEVKAGEVVVVLGYSGWGRAQLDGEIAQGTWVPFRVKKGREIAALVSSYQRSAAEKDEEGMEKDAEVVSPAVKPIVRVASLEKSHSEEKAEKSVPLIDESNVPYPAKMWKDVFTAMGHPYKCFARLCGVTPLRMSSL